MIELLIPSLVILEYLKNDRASITIPCNSKVYQE